MLNRFLIKITLEGGFFLGVWVPEVGFIKQMIFTVEDFLREVIFTFPRIVHEE